MKHVLYLTYDGLTDPLGESQILPYILGLSKTGDYRFTLISFEKPDRYTDGASRIRKQIESHPIAWTPMIYHGRPPVLSTVYDLIMLKRKVRRLYKTDAFRTVHCRSYLTALLGLWTKRNYGVKFLFDMRGFWADERIEGGIWSPKNSLYRFIYNWFKRKERALLIEADHIVSLTHKARDIMNAWKLKTEPLPVTVIPCCVDLKLFDPKKISELDQERLRSELGIQKSDFILSYIGSLGTWYMVEEMVEYFSQLQLQKPQAKFLVCTRDNPQVIWSKAAEHGIAEESIIIRSVQRDQMPLYISLSHYSIFFIRPTFSKQASSPTKMGEIMAMGVPVIVNKGIGD